jgi:hypothetical protein
LLRLFGFTAFLDEDFDGAEQQPCLRRKLIERAAKEIEKGVSPMK